MAIRPIVDTLRRIGKGVFIDRISEELARVVRETENTGKPCELQIRLRVSPAARGGALIVEGFSAMKLGKAPSEDALLWSTPEGNLMDRDPSQGELPLREVQGAAAAESAPLKSAAGEGAPLKTTGAA